MIISLFVNLISYLLLPVLKKTGRSFSKKDHLSEDLNCWFHCSSVGELSILKEIVPQYKLKHQLTQVLITTFSASSYKIAKEYFKRDKVMLFPLDIPCFHRDLFNHFKITKLVIAETEIWPFLLFQASRQKIEVVFVNALITDSSYSAYLKLSRIFPYFSSISKVITKSSIYIDRWKKLGVVNVIGGVDVKAVDQLVDFSQCDIRSLYSIAIDSFIPILVSIRGGEEELFLTILDISDKIIVVPRHFSTTLEKLIDLCDRNEITWVRTSYMNHEVDSYNDFKVIIVDEFGVLDTYYKLASCAFVGGTFVDIGGHNILEPLKYKLPTCCGDSLYNQLFAKEVATSFAVIDVISNKKDFPAIIEHYKSIDQNIFFSAIGNMINYIRDGKTSTINNI